MNKKKSLRVLVIALAVVMVFGVCSTAFAGAIGSWEYLESSPHDWIYKMGTASIESFHGYTTHHYFGSLSSWNIDVSDGYRLWAGDYKGGYGSLTVTIRNWYTKDGNIKGENRQFTMGSNGSIGKQLVGGQNNW